MASGQPETEAEVQAGQAGLARGRETGGGQEVVFVICQFLKNTL